jgi:hypothetical protein
MLFYNEEADPACAFALAVDLVRHDMPYVRDLPVECPQCAAPAVERLT